MGSVGTHNDVIAAAIPICGGADISKAEIMINTPIKTYHGANDPIVFPEGTRKMVKALQDLNAHT